MFGAAALTASSFPNGATVAANMNDVMMGVGKPVLGRFPAPAPAIGVPDVVVNDGSGVAPPVVPPEPGPTD